jgi:probable F420-dependent oxidoreductase
VLYGYLAALTKNVELVTGVIILPQRQTVLVAKQAAEVDLLSGGRLRLGIGVGWNDVEFLGLNENFHNRGVRSEEQIALMRALWTAPVVDFKGRWHTIEAAGIKPLPVQRPIPIWIGGGDDRTLRRVARIGDGWFPQSPPDDTARLTMARLREYIAEAGRASEEVGIEARLSLGAVPEAQWTSYVAGWRELGATHICVNTMGAGFTSVQAHLDALRKAREVLAHEFAST